MEDRGSERRPEKEEDKEQHKTVKKKEMNEGETKDTAMKTDIEESKII